MATVVYYSGDVQGVGFRATAASLARAYPVHGWVRNLADGRVELYVDGSPETVAAYLGRLRRAMSDYIRDVETAEREADPSIHGFRIVR